jgi:hypothetical protein
MHVDDRFAIRAYRDGDETSILDLFERSFHAARSDALWRWKYRNDPWGREHISVALDVTGRLVGHYAGYAVPFVDGRAELIAHQIGDTMTDPAIRHVGRGPTSILGRTARHFYETFCDGRIAFNYGFNVANIQKFSLRFLRSDRVEPVTYRRLSARGIRGLTRWERYARGCSFDLVREATPELDDFFERVREAYGFLVHRDARYLRWRYLECPDVAYQVVAIRKWRRLAGWIVFRVRDRRFVLGDVLLDPHEVDTLLVALRHFVPRFPVDVVEGWLPPRPAWFGDALVRSGFETVPEPQDLSLMCVPFMLSDAVARMRERLYYTWGDSDLF